MLRPTLLSLLSALVVRAGVFSWRHDFSLESINIMFGIWSDQTAGKFDLNEFAEEIYADKFDHRRRPDYSSTVRNNEVVVKVVKVTDKDTEKGIELGQMGVVKLKDAERETAFKEEQAAKAAREENKKDGKRTKKKTKKTNDAVTLERKKHYKVELENRKGECTALPIYTLVLSLWYHCRYALLRQDQDQWKARTTRYRRSTPGRCTSRFTILNYVDALTFGFRSARSGEEQGDLHGPWAIPRDPTEQAEAGYGRGNSNYR
jgi:hypothetical protein